jgi:hypothetical protein
VLLDLYLCAMRKSPLVLFVLLLWSSCKQRTGISDSSKEQVKAQCTRTLYQFFADINKDGFVKELDYLDNHPDFFWNPPGYNASLSYDSVCSIVVANAKQFVRVNMMWEDLLINPQSETLATYTGRINCSMNDTLDHALRFHLLEAGVLIKRDKGWKLLCGQTAMVTP